MLDEWLTVMRRLVQSSWRAIVWLFGFLLIALTLLLIGPHSTSWMTPPVVAWTPQDDPGFRDLQTVPKDWQAAPAHRIDGLQTPGWLYWEVPAALVSGATPHAVEMSGPFSAELYWNGQAVGSKGEVQTAEGRERAGPIDALIAIPADAIAPQNNRLLIRIVSSQAGYQPAAIVQSLSIEPYRADARRSLRYYLPSLSLLGVMLVLIVTYVRFWHQRRDARLLWMIAALAGLWIADLAEISRALINYPYSWHQPRQAVAMAGLFVFAVSVFGFILTRWLQTTRRATLICLGIAVTGLGVQITLSTGYDARSSFGLGWMFALSSIALLWGARRKAVAWVLLLTFAAASAYLNQFPSDFLDRAIYVLATAALALAIGFQRDVLSPPHVLEPEPERLLVQAAGEQISVPITDIAFLKAAGNYTEIHRIDGRWHLDSRSLKSVLEQLPDHVLRIHRSHAVPLARIDRISTAQGTRYAAHLDTGATLSISRGQVSDLRARLAR